VAEDLAVAQRPLARLALTLLVIAFSNGIASASARTGVLTDLEINEAVPGDAVVFGADLVLGPLARVDGDAVAVGGSVRVAEGAEVSGHVVAVFGETLVAPGTKVGGRVLPFSSLASLMPAPSGQQHTFQASVSMRLLTAGGWLLVTTGLAFLFPVRMRYAAWAVPVLGIRIPALGIMAGLTVMAALIAALGLGPGLGVPLVAGLMVVFFVAKAVGLTVLGCWIGAAALRRFVHHPLTISLEVFVGALILIALRFLPFVGETLWNLVSLVALGASIAVVGVTPDAMRAEASNTGQ
jgi:hypothetical protein